MSTEYQRLVPDYSKYRSRLAISGVDGDESASLEVTSVPSLTNDSQVGAHVRVCADEKDRADFDQRC
jgi:hypothetical protein